MKKTAISFFPFLLSLITMCVLLSCAGLGKSYEPVQKQKENSTVSDRSAPEKKPVAPKGEPPQDTAKPDSEISVPQVAAVKTEASPSPSPKEGKIKTADASAKEDSFISEEKKSGGTTTFASETTSKLDPRPPSVPRSANPSVSGLKAGFADDNKQFNYFVNFLKQYELVPHIPIPVQERFVVTVRDRENKTVPNARIEVLAGNTLLCSGNSLADGSFRFFPAEYDNSIASYTIRVSIDQEKKETKISRNGERNITIALSGKRAVKKPIPLDVVFIFDTTGSMGEEIERLKTTIELIYLNLSNLSAKPDIRFGMVLYKDVGDEYRTEIVPLSGDMDEFQSSLELVEASGGGDTPEDLQAALNQAMKTLSWNKDGIRLGFIITDAPPHLDYPDQGYTYADACRDAREQGIKLFSVGTGGLPLEGEYVLRQISQYTGGKYIFLTYGESGESSGRSPGSVSHHTGSNFQTDKLEAIIIRFAKEELAYLTDAPIEEDDSYFEAKKIVAENREETLDKLFNQSLSQLVDYSTISLKEKTPAAILPLSPADPSLTLNAEYFTEQFMLAGSKSPRLRIVERKDLQHILEEIELRLSDPFPQDKAPIVGKFLGAELLVSGRLYKKGGDFELFLKLLRVETGEVLAVTKAKIDKNLGL